jgi:glycosyltransferase involved in cell wall biosynthesis
LVVSWSKGGGANDRADDMARVLDGSALVIHPFAGLGAARKAARYLFSLPATTIGVVRRRPEAVVAQSPPVFCSLAAYVAARVLRVPFVLDAHPGAFGLMGDGLSARLLPITRRLVPKATATLVTVDELAAQVDAWGGHGVVFHEAPPTWTIPARSAPRGERFEVLYVGTFQPDEPIDVLLAAAAAQPDVDFVATGDVAKAPAGVLDHAPSNVRFCGYLDANAYVAALESADAVVVLTDEPTSVARSGYDAVWAHRPLVITGSDASRDAFPLATFVDNSADSLADAIQQVSGTLAERSADAVRAAEQAHGRWAGQSAALRAAIVRAG